jgi:hypothetical protein
MESRRVSGAQVEESHDYLTTQILTYLGNKRALLPFIGAGVEAVKQALGKERITFFDVFAGSGVGDPAPWLRDRISQRHLPKQTICTRYRLARPRNQMRFRGLRICAIDL